jgi:hypothetical protein
MFRELWQAHWKAKVGREWEARDGKVLVRGGVVAPPGGVQTKLDGIKFLVQGGFSLVKVIKDDGTGQGGDPADLHPGDEILFKSEDGNAQIEAKCFTVKKTFPPQGSGPGRLIISERFPLLPQGETASTAGYKCTASAPTVRLEPAETKQGKALAYSDRLIIEEGNLDEMDVGLLYKMLAGMKGSPYVFVESQITERDVRLLYNADKEHKAKFKTQSNGLTLHRMLKYTKDTARNMPEHKGGPVSSPPLPPPSYICFFVART